MSPLLALALATAAWWLVRRRMAESREHASAQRLVQGSDGIVRGAEPIERLAASGVGVLLLHGFGDTPQTLHYVATRLHAEGMSVRAPLLPGHGRSLQAFAASGAAEWIELARAELRLMRARHDRVVLLGVSMGGALAATLAAEEPDVNALVLLAPYLTIPPRLRQVARLRALCRVVARYVPTRGEASILDAEERRHNLAYGYATPRLLNELCVVVERAREQLPRVSVPTLMVQSSEDSRIAAADASRAFELLGGAEKQLAWVSGCSHLVTVDHCRERVLAHVVEFLRERLELASLPLARK